MKEDVMTWVMSQFGMETASWVGGWSVHMATLVGHHFLYTQIIPSNSNEISQSRESAAG